MRAPQQLHVAVHAVVLLRERLRLTGRIPHAPPVDEERDPVDERIEQEGRRPDRGEEDRRDDDPGREPQQRRALEAGCGASAQRLVVGGHHRDVAEDRGDARGGRGALEPARAAEHQQVRRERGEDHRNGPEDWAVEHHLVVADPIRQRPEHGRQDELCQIERRREDPDNERVDRLTAMLGERREVDGQHRSREAGAEAQRERAADDGPQGTIHAREA